MARRRDLHPSKTALRMRAHRARLRNSQSVYPVTVDGEVLDALES
jgi:hypothetical protein